MLTYNVVEKGFKDGQYGLIRKSPVIVSVSKGVRLHSALLASAPSHRYIFNEVHTFEKMVNYNLHCLRRMWEAANNSPFLFSYDWNEEENTEKAMQMALESLRALKSRMASPIPTFEPMEEPDIPW